MTTKPNGHVLLATEMAGDQEYASGVALHCPPSTPCPALLEFDEAGRPTRARAFGDSQSAQLQFITAAPNGDLFLVGSEFEKAARLGGKPAPYCGQGAGEQLAIVTKLDGTFANLWNRAYGACDARTAISYLGIKGDGGLVTTGNSIARGSSIGSGQVKGLAANGNLLWAREIPSAIIDGAALDHTDDSVIVAGRLTSATDFGQVTITPSSSEDLFMARLDRDNHWAWARSFGGRGNLAYWLTLDAQRNVLVTGQLLTVDFGKGQVGGGTAENAYAAKFDADGQLIWSRVFDGAESNSTAAAIDAAGNLSLALTIFGSVHVGSQQFDPTGSSDVVFVQLDSRGKIRWAEQAEGAGRETAFAAIATGTGAVAFSGLFDIDLKLSPRFGGAYYRSTQDGLSDIFALAIRHSAAVAVSASLVGQSR